VVDALDATSAVRDISFAKSVHSNEAVVTSACAPRRGVGVQWADSSLTELAVNLIAAEWTAIGLVTISVACCWARSVGRDQVACLLLRIIKPASRAIDRARNLVCHPSYSIAVSCVGAWRAHRRITLAVVCVPAAVVKLRSFPIVTLSIISVHATTNVSGASAAIVSRVHRRWDDTVVHPMHRRTGS
jgi:hypothetical protein